MSHGHEKKDDLDEAMVLSYMENPNGDGPKDEDRRDYFKARYDTVKSSYKMLQLNREELVSRKDEESLDKLTKAFRQNYKERVSIVNALRNLGEKIEDRAVPLAEATKA